jgi:hypothetical protein
MGFMLDILYLVISLNTVSIKLGNSITIVLLFLESYLSHVLNFVYKYTLVLCILFDYSLHLNNLD